VSLVFYLRILTSARRIRDYAWFAATAMLAICTKDQAYGLYALTPLVIVWEEWRAQPDGHRSVARAVFNPRIGAALVAGVAAFVVCDNVIFNYSGFVNHVRMITGGGSQPYQAFDATLRGRWDLLKLTVDLTQQAMGWPFFVASIAGVGLALLNPAYRRAAIWLLVPVVSYYLTFIDVVLYNYDRFVLPICLVLAFFGGLAFDRLLTSGGKLQTWRILATAVAFGYTLLYAVSVDVLMAGDSRYDAQHWLAAHARRDDLIGHAFDPEYLPNFGRFRHGDIKSIEDLRKQRPVYYVVNADYARAVPRDSRPLGPLLDGLERGTLGYRLAYRFRRNLPWSWLPGGHGDLVGSRLETRVFSTLRNVNPTIEIFEREAPGGAR